MPRTQRTPRIPSRSRTAEWWRTRSGRCPGSRRPSWTRDKGCNSPCLCSRFRLMTLMPTYPREKMRLLQGWQHHRPEPCSGRGLDVAAAGGPDPDAGAGGGRLAAGSTPTPLLRFTSSPPRPPPLTAALRSHDAVGRRERVGPEARARASGRADRPGGPGRPGGGAGAGGRAWVQGVSRMFRDFYHSQQTLDSQI